MKSIAIQLALILTLSPVSIMSGELSDDLATPYSSDRKGKFKPEGVWEGKHLSVTRTITFFPNGKVSESTKTEFEHIKPTASGKWRWNGDDIVAEVIVDGHGDKWNRVYVVLDSHTIREKQGLTYKRLH